MNFIGTLINAFRKTAEPKAKSEVTGFTVCLEKKEGILLHYQSEKGVESAPASENSYYEVTVTPTGKNAEYPASEAMRACFTIALNSGIGFANGVHFIPQDSKYKAFKVYENYDDGEIKGMFTGRRRPPHHTVTLKAEFKSADGRTSRIELGAWIRKSELESSAWKASNNNPIIDII